MNEPKEIILRALKEAIAKENFAQIVNQTKLREYAKIYNAIQNGYIEITEKNL